VDERTRQWRNDMASLSRRILTMPTVAPAEHVACVFDDRVLKAPAGAKKWRPALSRVANGKQCTFHAAIRTARYAPQSSEANDARDGNYFLRWHPFVLHVDRERL